ncbi:MAG: hypothetical protein ACFCVD_17670 [Nodosilinea sp.]
MLCYVQPDPWVLQEPRDLNPLRLDAPSPQPGRERLRHLVIGSPSGVRGAINHLHLLHYAERLEWSQLITIPDAGIVITPQQGEVLSYLLRHRALAEGV